MKSLKLSLISLLALITSVGMSASMVGVGGAGRAPILATANNGSMLQYFPASATATNKVTGVTYNNVITYRPYSGTLVPKTYNYKSLIGSYRSGAASKRAGGRGNVIYLYA